MPFFFHVLYFLASKASLRPIKPPVQWGLSVLTRGTKWLRRDANQSHPFKSEVNEWNNTSIGNYLCRARDNFYFASLFSHLIILFPSSDFSFSLYLFILFVSSFLSRHIPFFSMTRLLSQKLHLLCDNNKLNVLNTVSGKQESVEHSYLSHTWTALTL